jgi:hypothetical protein
MTPEYPNMKKYRLTSGYVAIYEWRARHDPTVAMSRFRLKPYTGSLQ